MKRGLIVGNSHAAALKLAAAEDETVAYDVFAIEGGGGPSLRAENARIFGNGPKTCNCSVPRCHATAGMGLPASVRRMASMARRPRRRAVSTTERISA